MAQQLSIPWTADQIYYIDGLREELRSNPQVLQHLEREIATYHNLPDWVKYEKHKTADVAQWICNFFHHKTTFITGFQCFLPTHQSLELGTGFEDYPFVFVKTNLQQERTKTYRIAFGHMQSDVGPTPREDVYAKILRLIQGSLEGRSYYPALTHLRGGEAQTAINIMDQTLKEPYLHPNLLHGRDLHRLPEMISTLFAQSGKLPVGLLVHGVSDASIYPVADGLGGHGSIHTGKYQREKVALKRVNIRQDQINWAKNAELCREALAWRYLDHSNVVKFLGLDVNTFRSMEMSCLVIEWIDGGTLLSQLQHHGQVISEGQRNAWIYDIARGLSYIHKKGIVHGDLHGSNIMLRDRRGLNPVITDFGLSVHAEANSRSQNSKRGGHPEWLAPELYQPYDGPEIRPTFKSDIYAFACLCVLTYTVDGKLYPQNPGVLVHRRVHDNQERPPIPPPMNRKPILTDLVRRCWDQQPQGRPTMADVLRRLGNLQPR